MKRFLKKQLPAALLALMMMIGMVPAASAARADIEVSVESGDEVSLSRSEFRSVYNQYSSSSNSSFYYVVFTDYRDIEDYGHLEATNKKGRTVTLDEDNLENVWFYDSSSDIEYDDDCALSGLTFVADKNAKAGTLTLKFTLQGTKSSDKVEGALDIEVDGSGSGSGTISYTVKAGGQVDLDADDFYDFFGKNYSNSSSTRSLRYVIFDRPSSSEYSDGTLYYNYGKSSQEAFTRSSLGSATFYYDDSTYGDYNLNKLTFVADKSFSGSMELTFRAYYSETRYVDGSVKFTASGKTNTSSSKGDVKMEVEPGDYVDFDADEFNDYFQEEYKNYDFKYLVFTDSDNLSSSTGYVYYNYGRSSKERFTASSLENAYFYYDEDDIGSNDTNCYPLDDLSFVASNGFDDTVTLEFRAYYSSSKYVDGTVTIVSTEDGGTKKGDIHYTVDPSKEKVFDEDDFNDYFQESYKNYTLKYVEFTDSENLNTSNGSVYYRYGRVSQVKFTASTLEDARFYYDSDDMPDDEEDCYLLEDISFVASSSFKTTVTLDFTAYYSNSKKVSGTVTIASTSSSNTTTTTPTSYYVGSVRYNTTTGTRVQINANDIARFFNKYCPGVTMQYVLLTGVPSIGTLYYNYYSTSQYGVTSRAQITTANASGQVFYASPTSTSQYALTELTYVPNGTNYCAAIPFTAYGGSRSVSGAILISVSTSAVAEVYGVTPKNTAVTFPASSIAAAVSKATGATPYSIQLLDLPSYTAGAVYVGSGSYTPADTTTQYTYYGSGSNSVSQLRFVPTTGFTGSVNIPYVALNSSGTAIASGVFALGVVNSRKTFTDVTESTWCYKYVAELSDASVIDGYSNGSFKPNSTITYGAALKLIMLAAGYPEQAPTTSNVFSGYLAKARADGIVTRSNVNLSASITRLQVAQLAASAMKLNTTNLSSVKPFTDTSDASVQALNAAGIVEGYFANGTSTFKPNNTLTRGQVSAIVWRMRNYNK